MNDEQFVITLTSAALKHIKNSIAAQKATGFRLAVKKTGCSGYAYVPDIINEAKSEDLKFEQDGVTVFVDQSSEKFLKGTVIDFVDQGMGQTKLLFHNPNAANLCGCGESFNLQEE